jgi:hypothetical protein
MTNNNSIAEEWLTREDNTCRQDRLARLNWLSSGSPDAEYWTFPGGLISKYLFEETRYCFVYGQFLATIVLGLSYIEHTLASLFYASGRNDLERASISTLLREALNCGWMNHIEFDNLQRARKIRNPITHFRRPGYDDTIEYRAVAENELPYTSVEEDAQHVLETVLHLLGKNSA